MRIPSLKQSKNLEKSREMQMDRLPDEIILEIFNKLIDLKVLCSCYLVSRRFSSIVLKVDAIAITAPLVNPPSPDSNHPPSPDSITDDDLTPIRPLQPFVCLFRNKSYTFLCKFKGVKSLFIQLPSSSKIGNVNRGLCKWKAKFGKRLESIMYLFPRFIRDKDGNRVTGDLYTSGNMDVWVRTFLGYWRIAVHFLQDATGWHALLLDLVKNLPMLEKVSITDAGRHGRLSLSGEKLIEMKRWLHSASATETDPVQAPNIFLHSVIGVLDLPVTGYLMTGMYFGAMKMNDDPGENDHLMSSNHGFEDKEEAAYTEAVMEILEKRRDKIIITGP